MNRRPRTRCFRHSNPGLVSPLALPNFDLLNTSGESEDFENALTMPVSPEVLMSCAKHIGTYDSSAGGKIEKFVSALRRHQSSFNLDETQARILVNLCVEGQAATTVDSLGADASFEDVLAKLESTFKKYISPKSLAQALNSISRRPEESIGEFAGRLERLNAKVKEAQAASALNETQLTNLFLNNMSGAVHRGVITAKVEGFRKTVELCNELEGIPDDTGVRNINNNERKEGKQGATSDGDGKENASSSKYCKYCKKNTDHVITDCPKRSAKANGPSTQWGNAGKTGRKARACFLCNQETHQVRSCPYRIQFQQSLSRPQTSFSAPHVPSIPLTQPPVYYPAQPPVPTQMSSAPAPRPPMGSGN